MTMYRVGPAGIPGSLKTNMDAVLNKKFGTSTTYAPATWPDNVNLLGPLPEKTASGSVASITDGADGVPLKNWLLTLPASLDGYSEVNGTQTGKNVIDISGTDTDNGYISGRWIGSNNSPNSNADWYTTEYLPILSNVDYTLSGIAYGNSPAFCFYDETKTFISGTAYSNRSTITFTSPNNAKYARFSIRNDFTAFMLEIGATATTYEPYTAPTVSTVSLGRTIYGGSVDVVAGTGTDENGNDFTFPPISPTPETALGVNNFWADEGDSEVTYKADINMLIASLSGNRGLMMSRPQLEAITEENKEEESPEVTEK